MLPHLVVTGVLLGLAPFALRFVEDFASSFGPRPHHLYVEEIERKKALASRADFFASQVDLLFFGLGHTLLAVTSIASGSVFVFAKGSEGLRALAPGTILFAKDCDFLLIHWPRSGNQLGNTRLAQTELASHIGLGFPFGQH